MNYSKIPITEVGGFKIGNAQDYNAMTGVTALVFDGENTAGIDISGGGPAARESYLFTPLAAKQSVTALLLSGGSAFGLAASDGAMRYLEERKKGYQLGSIVVPIVPQSCIFDLGFGSANIRPDAQMGYNACADSVNNNAKSGNIGGGTGATVGKLFGMRQAQKSGIGYYALQVGNLKVGACVIVNAFGDIYDYKTGKKVAGLLNEERSGFLDLEDELYALQNKAHIEKTNTTIGAIVTNAHLAQAELCKVAKMTRSALGQCIRPVGTTGDGDTVYAISTGNVQSDVNIVGTLAVKVLSEAILDAVISSAMENSEYLSHIL